MWLECLSLHVGLQHPIWNRARRERGAVPVPCLWSVAGSVLLQMWNLDKPASSPCSAGMSLSSCLLQHCWGLLLTCCTCCHTSTFLWLSGFFCYRLFSLPPTTPWNHLSGDLPFLLLSLWTPIFSSAVNRAHQKLHPESGSQSLWCRLEELYLQFMLESNTWLVAPLPEISCASRKRMASNRLVYTLGQHRVLLSEELCGFPLMFVTFATTPKDWQLWDFSGAAALASTWCQHCSLSLQRCSFFELSPVLCSESTS